MFALTTNKETLVANLWDFSEEGGWTPRFARPFNDWKLEEILCLLNTIQGERIFDSQDDLMILKETRDGCFSVKLLFKALVRLDDIVFPH